MEEGSQRNPTTCSRAGKRNPFCKHYTQCNDDMIEKCKGGRDQHWTCKKCDSFAPVKNLGVSLFNHEWLAHEPSRIPSLMH